PIHTLAITASGPIQLNWYFQSSEICAEDDTCTITLCGFEKTLQATYIVNFTITFHQYPFEDYLVDPSAFQAAHVTSVSGEDEVVKFLGAASGSTLTSSQVIYPPEVAASADFDCESGSTTSCGTFLATLTTNPAALFASSVFFADFLDEISVSGVTTTHLGVSSIVFAPPPPSLPAPPTTSAASKGDGEDASPSSLPAVLGSLGGVLLVVVAVACCYHYQRSPVGSSGDVGGGSGGGAGGKILKMLSLDGLPGCLQICIRGGQNTIDEPSGVVMMESNPTFSTQTSAHSAPDQAEGVGEQGVDQVPTSMAIAEGNRGRNTRSALLMLQQGLSQVDGVGGSGRRHILSQESNRSDDGDGVDGSNGANDGIVGGDRLDASMAGSAAPQGCDGLQEYTVAEVCQLVEQLGIPSAEFEAQEVNGALLCGLTAEELMEDLELTSAQARRQLCKQWRKEPLPGEEGPYGDMGGDDSDSGKAAEVCDEAGHEDAEENEAREEMPRLRQLTAELEASGAVARALSREVGAGAMTVEPTRTERLAGMLKLLQGIREPVKGRYEVERKAGQRQGASRVVCFAVDVMNGTGVAIKLFLDAKDFHTELANCRHCMSPFVVKVLDAHSPPQPSSTKDDDEAGLLQYGHMLGGVPAAAAFAERGAQAGHHARRVRGAVVYARRGVNDARDLKPANVVKFAAEDTWKLVDLATASSIREKAPVEYTLRYAAPEVIRAALEGHEVAAREPAADLWSAGVMMFELYTGRRLFGEEVADEEVVKQLYGTAELAVKGLAMCEVGAARLICDKLLVKEASERWPAEKVLSSSFFKRMDDTTKMSSASRELAKDVRKLSVMVEETARLAAVSVTEMQAGSLMAVEVQLRETSPKQQSCILTEHERAGPVFNLVPQCHYQLELIIFREGAGWPILSRQLPVTIRQGLHFLVHKKDGAKLRALRAYEWTKQEYLNMTPETRAAIRGMVFAVETAAGALL
ncbi:hypothetical protein CYMTET_23350, partial [Cymbomonas tetramitiformis]